MQQKRNTHRIFLKSQSRQTQLYKFIIPIRVYSSILRQTCTYTYPIATNHNNNNIKEISSLESDFDYTQCLYVVRSMSSLFVCEILSSTRELGLQSQLYIYIIYIVALYRVYCILCTIAMII